jgi:two-component system, NarL family, response regulator LiaR
MQPWDQTERADREQRREPHETAAQLAGAPLRVAVVNDYEVIVRGVAAMLHPFADRVAVVETEVGGVAESAVDVALFDTFGGHRTILRRAQQMVADRKVVHVVLYTWSADAGLLSLARASGVSGVLSKAGTANQLVDALERISRGERLGLDTPLRLAGQQRHPGQRSHLALGSSTLLASSRSTGHSDRSFPARLDVGPLDARADLTAREQEVLAMLGLGLSNRDIADELFLGVETVRTYVRQVYQKLGVKNRTQAAVRARGLGLEPAPQRRSAAS